MDTRLMTEFEIAVLTRFDRIERKADAQRAIGRR